MSVSTGAGSFVGIMPGSIPLQRAMLGGARQVDLQLLGDACLMPCIAAIPDLLSKHDICFLQYIFQGLQLISGVAIELLKQHLQQQCWDWGAPGPLVSCIPLGCFARSCVRNSSYLLLCRDIGWCLCGSV